MIGRVLRWVALGAIALYLAIAVPVALRNTFVRVRLAAATAGWPEEAVRARAFGRDYVGAIEKIRRAIPEDEPYLGGEQEEGALFKVRFDLLPRRALDVRAPGWHPRGCVEEQIRWLVVATNPPHLPLLFGRSVGVPPGCAAAPWIGRRR